MIISTSERSEISSFLAMDVLRRANAAEREGKDVIHMEVGQPAASAPSIVIDEAQKWLAKGRLGYTDALGLDDLRKRIAAHYLEKYAVDIDPHRVAVTTGSSGGFNLAFLAAFDVGDKIGLPSPGYPAYRNILAALGLEVIEIETTAEDRWTLSERALREAHTQHGLKGVLVASPANPSGTMLTSDMLKRVCITCKELDIRFISDEIYHGLVFEGEEETALRYSDEVIVVNSFSKYFCMTGWRVGWMILPENMVRTVERIAQNLFISAPELSQRAGVAAFDAMAEFEVIKAGYAENRAIIMAALKKMKLTDYHPVDGAFYFYVNVKDHTNDSLQFSQKMLDEIHLAATPGADFDPVRGHQYLRFSFAGSADNMSRAMERLGNWL